jgi:hypothetical protein
MDASTSHLLTIILAPLVLGFLYLTVATLLQPQSAAAPRRAVAASYSENNPLPELPFHILSVADAFDPERNILWASQIPFLLEIGRNGSFSSCLRVCEVSLRQYPELYEGTSAESWLVFLQSNQLAQVEGEQVRLTRYGRELLNFLMSHSGVATGGRQQS